jgi:hypothetical protein
MRTTLAVVTFAAAAFAQNANTALLPDLLDLRGSAERATARIDELAAEATLQTQLGNPQTAATIQAIVANLQAWRAGTTPVPPGAGVETHVVGFYEGFGATSTTPGTASVTVDRPGTAVVLVLNAYEPIAWTIAETPGTTVLAVVAYSYEVQTLQTAGVPSAVVLQLSYAANNDGTHFGTPESDAEGRLAASAWCIERLGGLPTTFVGAYTAPSSVLEVGANNTTWRDQWIVEQAVREGTTWNVATRAQLQAGLGGVLFLPLLTPPMFTFAPATVAVASALGVLAPIVPLAGVTDYVLGNSAIYTLAGGDPSTLDLTTLTSTPIPPDPTLPAFSWVNTISHDTVRDRLWVSSFGGSGVLYAYDVATSTWSLLAPSLNNQEPAALAYHPTHDATFGLLVDPYASAPYQLRQYDALGNVVATQPLALPVFSDLLDNHQLYPYGAALAYVGPARELLGFLVRHCYVLDPFTGDVLYAGYLLG